MQVYLSTMTKGIMAANELVDKVSFAYEKIGGGMGMHGGGGGGSRRSGGRMMMGMHG